MSVFIRIRNGIIHLVINQNGKRKEETTGLHLTNGSL